jgi:hypothetical protein
LDEFDLDLMRLRRPREIFVKRMRDSLKNQGQLTPLIVSRSDVGFLLIDGFKRHQAASSLNWSKLDAAVVDANARQAKAMIYLLNRSDGFSMVQEAVLIRELMELDGLSQTETAILLERHKSWISRRLDMIRRLLPEIVDDLLLDLIPDGAAPSLARIPLCNQADFCASIRVNRLAPTEIRRLADLYCKAPDPAIKKFIIQSPKAALEGLKKQYNSTKTSWSAKLKLILKIIAVLENDLEEKRPRVEKATMEKIETVLDRVRTVLCEALSIIEKEKTWEKD